MSPPNAAPVHVRLLTLAYHPNLGAIDSRPLDHFLADKELLELREHFFVAHGLAHLCCVVTYRQAGITTAECTEPAAPSAVRTHPHFTASRHSDKRIELDDRQRARFATLRGWRAQRARRDGVPAYVVFTNRELAALATSELSSRSQLMTVPGCGEGKVARYGDELLALFAPADDTTPTPADPPTSPAVEPTPTVPRSPLRHGKHADSDAPGELG